MQRHEACVSAICELLSINARFNDDPRGFSVKLQFRPEDPQNQPYNTWGGAEDGWGIG